MLINLSNIKIEEVCEVLKLDKDKTLSEDVLRHCPPQAASASVKQLMELLCSLGRMRVKKSSVLEYCCQDKASEVFAETSVDFDETWLLEKVESLEKFWLGERFAQGVDIEEAWKCSNCCFADNCDWRKAKSEELLRKTAISK